MLLLLRILWQGIDSWHVLIVCIYNSSFLKVCCCILVVTKISMAFNFFYGFETCATNNNLHPKGFFSGAIWYVIHMHVVHMFLLA
jgi:hypothetical protein